MMRFEYDQKFIKLLAKEMVKEMQKVKDEAKEPELITVKEAAETLNLSEDYVRKIKDKLPHVKQGNSKQGRILFVKEGRMDAYLNAVGKTKECVPGDLCKRRLHKFAISRKHEFCNPTVFMQGASLQSQR